jgi:3-deoxy-D-manno-octulosonate 8-phosphate phosphatase (KDO 8-P phosphatase)
MINNKAKTITTIVTDVDGVLTDGGIFMSTDQHSEMFSRFNIQDGMGIKIAQACNIDIIVLSGRKSLNTERRCYELGVKEVFTGVSNKKTQLIEIVKRLSLSLDSVAYIGDDVIDLPAMQICGLTVAPANAVPLVKQSVDYITQCHGGHGALRELIDIILTAQNKYDDYLSNLYD